MKKRVFLIGVLAVAAAAGAALAVPLSRDVILGYVAGEPFQDGRPLRYWLRTLRAGDPQEREQAAHALGQLGPVSPEVLPALAEALGDECYIVRRNAAEALGRIGPPARDAA